MNVQASESMNEAWTSLQGHVINSAFPLHRFINGSEHTGVFLAESRRHRLAQVAVKLVRAVPARADAQLSRWLTADGLAHSHLVRIFEAGRCQIGGLQYLYAVMEYADQNLAELLDHRALTEDEAREMLAPTLSALAFLHDRKYVQGQLKPSNFLVVGDQLKLASDTIRRAGESLDTDKPMTVYDPPEARGGSYWPAGDVWALGVSLCEALTRNRPVGLHDGGRPVAFPRDFPAGFREIVGRCLSRRPHDRPSVADFDAWLRGKQAQPEAAPKAATREVSEAASKATREAPAPVTKTAMLDAPVPEAEVPAPASNASARDATASKASAHDASAIAYKANAYDTSASAADAPTHDAPAAPPKAGTIEVSEAALGPAPHETTASEAATPQPGATSSQPPVMTGSASQRTKPPSTRRTVVVTLAAAVAVGLLWTGARMLRTQQAPLTPPTADVIDEAALATSAPPQTQSEATLAAPNEPAIPAAPIATNISNTTLDNTPAEPEPEVSAGVVTQVMPDVPRRAQQTIRGHVKTSVRLIVDPDGTVFAALVDDAGPSRYFARLAIEAAKNWTFTPADVEGQRLVQVQFDFSRDGMTARAVPLK